MKSLGLELTKGCKRRFQSIGWKTAKDGSEIGVKSQERVA
jgi:hypothetical protein